MNFPLSGNAPEFTKQEIRVLIDDLQIDNLKNSGVRVVYPVGDGSSGIFFVGEAPGVQEDKLGEPFVGASGKFFNTQLLPSVGLTRHNIYLTNIVKCRPPQNRDPLPEEKEAWSPILLAEILAVKPKLIVCLGRHSMGFFLPKAKISRIHGQIQTIKLYDNLTLPMLPLYHPAVALYDPRQAGVLKADFMVIQNFLDGNFKLQTGTNLSPNLPSQPVMSDGLF